MSNSELIDCPGVSEKWKMRRKESAEEADRQIKGPVDCKRSGGIGNEGRVRDSDESDGVVVVTPQTLAGWLLS